MRNVVIAAILAVSAGFATGCNSKPKGNTEACKTSSKDGDACKKCCNEAGVSGYMWNGMSNECKCM